jgi:hypothetical protein
VKSFDDARGLAWRCIEACLLLVANTLRQEEKKRHAARCGMALF